LSAGTGSSIHSIFTTCGRIKTALDAFNNTSNMSSSEQEAEFDDDSEVEEEEEDQEEDDDDDDAPISGTKRKSRTSTSKPIVYADDCSDDEDDSDDDMPLASLKSSPKKAKAPTKKDTKKEGAKKKAPVAKPLTIAAAAATNTTTTKADKYTSVSEAFYNSGCKKGLMVQRLLARWWYAMDWPVAKDLKDPPPLYDALDGFPGVYVCTDGDKVGHIHDMRDSKKAPCFTNMAKKSAEELKGLLLKALEQQKVELIRSEGKGTSTEKEIDDMIKETNKINSDKADKEAATLLKAGKLTL
jgi:hypothetical protein